MYVIEKEYQAIMTEIRRQFPKGILVKFFNDFWPVIGYRVTKRHLGNGETFDRNIKLIIQRGDMEGTGWTGRQAVDPLHCGYVRSA
jgi:hypothetical protein